jgi:hypothetical protein
VEQRVPERFRLEERLGLPLAAERVHGHALGLRVQEEFKLACLELGACQELHTPLQPMPLRRAPHGLQSANLAQPRIALAGRRLAV